MSVFDNNNNSNNVIVKKMKKRKSREVDEAEDVEKVEEVEEVEEVVEVAPIKKKKVIVKAATSTLITGRTLVDYSNPFGLLPDDTDGDNEDAIKNSKKLKATIESVFTSSTTTTTTTERREIFKEYSEVYGEQAKLGVEIANKSRYATIRDIQHYIKWLLSDFAETTPNWIFTKNKPLLQKLVVVVVPAIDDLLYEKVCLLSGKEWFTDKLPHSSTMKIHTVVPSKPPSQSLYEHLFTVKTLVAKEKRQGGSNGKVLPASGYLLADDELIENGYPQSKDCTASPWARAVLGKDNDPFNLLAVDCEMCVTTTGKELTRISIVDENNTVLMDEYVKPDNPITDYVTRFSGISEETLRDVTTTLNDIQVKLKHLIKKNTILIGHSLENDLNAMKFYHPHIIDTSVCFPTGNHTKFPLRVLVKRHLGRVIQAGNDGHNSIEDAKAVMDLVKLKIEKGKDYGTSLEHNENLFSILHKYNKRATMIDTIEEITQHSTNVVSCVKCNTKSEVAERAMKELRGSSDFIIFKLYQLADHYKAVEKLSSEESQQLEQQLIQSINDDTSSEGKAKKQIMKELSKWDGTIPVNKPVFDVFQTIDDQLTKIYDQMTSNSMLMVLFGPGAFNCINRFQNDPDKAEDYVLAVETAKLGMVKIGIK
ncbi:hypothetical protein SAMD00019534_043070 [Acytostelium subglobosum LB1]|uniref:hypothetical protein n=1 Tax=Acytostelium subglobosum LB1 TaxID=1410327 RepID=UPI000644ED6D|nr:hypothetical protein SAMD00019534_043070 [Acytostelium subglobosum LB1]GAM21132.1 hypothetical protein SAMD00019534_043070 [Acytostelium subglobosum LB1]|eukprot:XP_012756266.1 hypothetical protein SAMD00019534_043070 [Acytostelium subglobosum LB1]